MFERRANTSRTSGRDHVRVRPLTLAAVLTVALSLAPAAPAFGTPSHLREWLALVGHPRPVEAATTERDLRQAAAQPQATVLLVGVYRLASPYGSQMTGRAVVVKTDRPARYLLGMGALLATAGRPAYVQVIDVRGRTVFEWYSARRRSTLYVRPDLEGCSPAKALGWSKIPRCPVK